MRYRLCAGILLSALLAAGCSGQPEPSTPTSVVPVETSVIDTTAPVTTTSTVPTTRQGSTTARPAGPTSTGVYSIPYNLTVVFQVGRDYLDAPAGDTLTLTSQGHLKLRNYLDECVRARGTMTPAPDADQNCFHQQTRRRSQLQSTDGTQDEGKTTFLRDLVDANPQLLFQRVKDNSTAAKPPCLQLTHADNVVHVGTLSC